MTTEEKAKAYDEALERMKDFLKEWKNCGALGEAMEKAKAVFPELKESEDDKIKGAIIDHLKDYNLIEWAAWLEKQGEQKPTNVCEGCNNVKACVACVDGSEWAHIEEAEPTAWSEEDKKMSRFIGNAITADGASEYLESKGIQVIDAHVWLDELKERVRPQNTWKPSEKQMEALEVAQKYVPLLEGSVLDSLYNELKNLK